MRSNNDAEIDPSMTATPSSSGPTAHMPSYLGPGLKIKGQIIGDEDLAVDGKVEGPISLGEHRLTIGRNAHVLGEIVSREIVIYGDVTGKLRAHDRIEIKKDGSVMGELTTGRIMIEDGANFKGAEIERSSAKVATDCDTLLALAEKDFKLKSIRSVGSGQP